MKVVLFLQLERFPLRFLSDFGSKLLGRSEPRAPFGDADLDEVMPLCLSVTVRSGWRINASVDSTIE